MDTILLTATINPKGMINVAMTNPEERLADYKKAIEFYVNETNFNVIFCDNSNNLLDINSLNIKVKTRKKDIEILTFNGNSKKDKGKGYGEMEIINHTLRNSIFLKGMNKKDRIIVATGRLIIKNAVSFCNVYQKNEIYFYKYDNKMISVFNIAPIYFWKEFCDKLTECVSDDAAHTYFENRLEEFAVNNYSNILNYVKYPPHIIGKTGTAGIPYNQAYDIKDNDKLNMFICTHKEFDAPKDDYFIPITSKHIDDNKFVDATINNDRSYKDQAYSELVEYYWLWKNFYAENYIGISHYRKYFKEEITNDTVDKLMKDCDAIVSMTNFHKPIKRQYQDCHNINDLNEVQQIIKELYGETEAKSFDRIMNGNIFLQCNMIVTTSGIFNKYCEVLFAILDEFDKRRNLTDAKSYIDYVDEHSEEYIKKGIAISTDFYQSRIPGYLSERIFTWYFLTKTKRLKTSDIIINK